MNKFLAILLLILNVSTYAQESSNDSIVEYATDTIIEYKKRVLETTEVDFMFSYY